MKILQAIDFFSIAHGGGTVDFVYKLSRALTQKGHGVVIYTGDFELDQEYIDSLPQVKVYPFHSWLNLAGVHLMPSIVMEVKRKLKEFDIIHLHCLRSFQNIVIHHYAKRYGVPYVLQAHGSVATYFQKRTLKRIFDRVWGYRILKDASSLVALTPMEVHQYKNMVISEDKTDIVPNGIDLSEFQNLPQMGEFKKKYGLKRNQKIILYLARIHKIKGPDLLAKAFAGLTKELVTAKLVIVGQDDGYLSTLKQLIKELHIEEQVLFTGALYGREKLEAYVDAEIYVLPSLYEIFGITILEACACGTPVIVTDRCGLADAIDEEAGLVVPYDQEHLQRALLRMLGDNKMRLKFGERGKSLMREKFNWQRVVEQVERVYLNCISSRC